MKRLMMAVILAATTLVAQPALAHKVIIDVYANETDVEGEIGFSNGDVASNSVVNVYDDKDNLLGTTKTDADGVFHYTPTKAVDLVFKSNLGAGHIAFYKMAKEDLPEAVLEGKTAGQPAAKAETASAGSVSNSELKTMIAKEVIRAVRPLQKELAAYREKKDVQSILGGLGYIMGLFGVAFFVMARRKNAGEA